jgi:hypothetical protein
MPNSLHYEKLAQDLNLFVYNEGTKKWDYKASDCPEWRAIGAYWEGLHTLTRWGGNWDKDANIEEEGEDDLNHVSITYGNRA